MHSRSGSIDRISVFYYPLGYWPRQGPIKSTNQRWSIHRIPNSSANRLTSIPVQLLLQYQIMGLILDCNFLFLLLLTYRYYLWQELCPQRRSHAVPLTWPYSISIILHQVFPMSLRTHNMFLPSIPRHHWRLCLPQRLQHHLQQS